MYGCNIVCKCSQELYTATSKSQRQADALEITVYRGGGAGIVCGMCSWVTEEPEPGLISSHTLLAIFFADDEA